MPAKSPTLDNRALNDILEQLQGLACDNVPEWHPPEEGDAGTMLQRIFARLLEIALERLNNVPEKNLLAFLDVMGVSLLPPSTAKVPLNFSLTPGNPAMSVPMGTQASTQTSGEQPAVIFETEDDLTVIPAQLTMGFAMDPAWDRCADQTSLLGGENAIDFTPFVGTKRISHVLYIGDDALLNFSRGTTVEFKKIEEGTFSQNEWECLKTLSWKYRSKDAEKTTVPTVGEILKFTISDPINQETVHEVGLAKSIQSRWLRGELTTPFPDAQAAQDLRLKNLILKVSAGGLLPDLAFSNTAPVDVTKDFFPFGETPKVGDTFYIGCRDAFSKPNVKVTLENLGTIVNETATLEWEFWGVKDWELITTSSNQNKDIVLQNLSCVEAEVNGQKNYWIRVRITEGNYGLPIEYEPVNPEDPTEGFKVKSGTGNLNPPVIKKLTLSYEAKGTPTVLTQNGFLYCDQTLANTTNGNGFAPFVSVKDLPPTYADAEPSFYLGFDAAFPEKPVKLYVAVAPRAFAGSVIREKRAASASSSALPPLSWEYSNGMAWRELTVFDGTNNFTESGVLEFLTPTDIEPLAKFDLTKHYWIRALSSENDPFDTQQLRGIFLNTIPAIQAVTVQNEILGSSNGQSNQTLRFSRMPVLPGQQVMVREPERPSEEECAVIPEEVGNDDVHPATDETEIWVRWHEVANFFRSGPDSRHYTLDRTNGLITFGDGKHGLIPQHGTNNITATYRVGGGALGNQPKGAVSQVVSPLPGIAGVTNPVAADGGAAAEMIQMVDERGPQTLKHRYRAVSCTDLEWLARQAAGTRVARIKCMPNVNRNLCFEPGWVTLIIIPQGTGAKLSPGSELIRKVKDYLKTCAFAGLAEQTPARVNIIGPGYIQVAVTAGVVPTDIDKTEQVKKQIMDELAAFFHPLKGGPDRKGWKFGRDVYESEISKVLEDISGVSHLKWLELIPNIVQHRITFASAPTAVMDFPEGSAVMTTDKTKAALLAEPLQMGASVNRIAVKGFKEGDRITKVLDLMVTTVDETKLTVTAIDGETVIIDAVAFPRGSIVTTFDGTRRTRLTEGIPRNKTEFTQIVVEDDDFAKPGDVLTIFYPFPMTITSVISDLPAVNASAQTLGIEPYETEITFPECSLFATLDNRVRMPLLTEASPDPANTKIASLKLHNFLSGDHVTISRRDKASELQNLTIQNVETVNDIVYLDDNFLVYSGAHRITMTAEEKPSVER